VVLATTLMVIVTFGSCADRRTVCGSIQERVDAASPGATVDLPDGCVYRESAEVNKPVTLVGGPGVWIKGSDVWSGWTELPSGLYRSEREVPVFPHRAKSGDPDQSLCEPGVGTTCGLPEQVFVHGSNLKQVHSEAEISPGESKFRLNPSNRVVMGVDPRGETVEVSVRSYWLRGGDDVDDVTVRDIRFAHAANGGSAALKNGDGGDAWVVKDCDIGWAASLNISLNRANAPGTRLVVSDNRIHHGGQEGLAGANDSPMTISGNEIYENNVENFNQSWDAGGVKISDPVDLVVDGNEIHHNTKGFWSDGGGRNITFTNNVVHHNLEAGVHFEITDDIVAHGNVLYDNGWGPAHDPHGSGEPAFKLVSVRNVDLYDNVLAWNEDSISVVNSARDDGVGATDPRFDGLHDVRVHHNDIVVSEDPGETNRTHYALAWQKNGDVTQAVCDQPGTTCFDEPGANNGGHDNRYWYPTPEGSRHRFVWGSELSRIEDFNRTRGEERGRYLSDTEKEQVLAAEKIPADPARTREE
jgi:hypothetical protein